MDGRGSVNGQLDDDTGIYMQRFNSDGSRFYSLSELRINYLTDGIQSNPSVVEGQDGSTAFVWQTDGSATNNGIWLRKVGYDVGYNNETRVNDVLTGIHANPKVGMNNGGDFVVVWQGSSANDNYDIHYKKYNLYSSTTNAEIQANYLVNGIQSNPDVVITDDNRIVIAWQTNGSIIGNDGIYSRYIDTPAGVPVEIKANSTISNDLSYPSISMNHSSGLYNNDFVITWMGNGDGDSTGIYQRRYNIGTLSPQNPEYRMNYLINGSQEKPAIALGTNSANDSNLLPTDLGYSKFITVWQTRNSTDSTDGIYALKTRNNNYSIANELKVNANTSVSGGASND